MVATQNSSESTARVGEGRQLNSAPAYAAGQCQTDVKDSNTNGNSTSRDSESDSPPATNIMYMNEPLGYCFSNTTCDDAKILKVTMKEGSGDKECTLVFDKSQFHPQGGGQPTDVGILECGDSSLNVVMVKVDKDSGVATHDCKSDVPIDLSRWTVGATVSMTVSQRERELNSRIHSAGHLLDAAVKECGFTWVPAKGYHFPDGPNVEYAITEEDKKEIQGGITNMKDIKGLDKAKEEMCRRLEEQCQKLIEEKGEVGEGVNVIWKEGVRHVDFCGVVNHCGGTHVDALKKLGKIRITKIQPKKDRVKISYKVE